MRVNMNSPFSKVSRGGIAVIVTVLTSVTLPLSTVAKTQIATSPLQQNQHAHQQVIEPSSGPPALADGLIIRFTASKATDSAAKSQSAQAIQHIEQANALSAATGVRLEFAHEVLADRQLFWLSGIVAASEAWDVAGKLLSKASALGIESVEPDYRLFPTLAPNDPDYSQQWHYQTVSATNYGMNLPDVWDIVTGSTSLVVAVIDTGILFNHPDLVGRTVPGYDFISKVDSANDGSGRDADASDPGDWVTSIENANGPFKGCGADDSSWHGSHVAGTIGAASNNGIGVTGINWRSKILPVRVLGKCGGSLSDIVAGMRWAAGIAVDGVPTNPNPARVINMSLGGSSTCSPVYQEAVNDVVARGVVVVVAAGNENSNASTSQPGNCDNVITVGSTRRDGTRASYSNFGVDVEVSAPGGSTSGNEAGGILSTVDSGLESPVAPSYAFYQGTSMATPNVAGVVSLMLSVQPLLRPAQVLQILQASVTAFPGISDCASKGCGIGIVDALKAVNAAKAIQISQTFMPALQKEVIGNATPGSDLTNGGFEAGRTSWTEVSAITGTHIIYSLSQLQAKSNSITPHTGTYLAWLGGGNFETGSISQNVIVPISATTISFWYRIGSSDFCGYDGAAVYLGSAKLASFDLCTDTVTAAWQHEVINIGSIYAGKSLTLKFEAITDESEVSNWYVDDVAFE